MKHKKHMLATAIVTSLSMNSSSLASEVAIDSELAPDNTDSNGSQIKLKDSSIGYTSEGGLLGSGFCCADCRDLDIIG